LLLRWLLLLLLLPLCRLLSLFQHRLMLSLLPLPRSCLLPAGGQRPSRVYKPLGAAEPVQQGIKVV
jgi:hypothetical protein